MIGKRLTDKVQLIGLPIIGSFLFIRGVSLFAGNFVSEFDQTQPTIVNQEQNGTYSDGIYYFVGFIAVASLAFGGQLVG